MQAWLRGSLLHGNKKPASAGDTGFFRVIKYKVNTVLKRVLHVRISDRMYIHTFSWIRLLF